MLSRRFILKLLCLSPLAGCVTPRRIWEEQARLDSDLVKLPPFKFEKTPEREPLPVPEEEFVPLVNVIARSYWTKSPVLKWRVCDMGRIYRLTVHHEGNPRANYSTNWSDVVSDLRLIRKVHLKKMSAGDIGYHYIIDRDGRIWQGRPTCYQGAHAGGSANKGNVGIMLLGNFDIQEPSDKQKKVLAAFLRKLMSQYGIGSSRVYTHQELKVTRCPGTHLQNYMNWLRRRL